MKHASKRILAWLLCTVMLLALLPAFAAAEEDTSPLDPPAHADGEPTEELPDDGDPALDEPTEELPDDGDPALDEPSEELPVTEPAEAEPIPDEPEGDDTELSEEPVRGANAVVVLDEELVPGTNYFEVEEPYTIYYRPVRPAEDGYYKFYANCAATRYAYLADSELNQLNGDYESTAFAFLHGGETYYFGLSNPGTGIPITTQSTLKVYPANACGNNMIWNFDAETGTLSFTGSGDMWQYEPDAIPWAVYKDQVETVDFRNADVNRIIAYAFYNYDNLTSVLFEDGFPQVENYAFCGTGIKEVYTKNQIGKYAFANCKDLETLTMTGSGCSIISDHAFYNSGLKTVTLKNGLNVQIQPYAFANCADLMTADFGNSLWLIGAHAFENSGIRTISTSSNLYRVGAYAFANCPNLITAQLPEGSGSTVIPEGCFKNSGIQSLYIPKNVETIEKDALYGCTKLAPDALTVDPNNNVFTAKDGLILTKDGKTTQLAVPSLTECTIPFGVQTIAGQTFYNMPLLTDVTLQPGVKVIETNAFRDCPALGSVTIPTSLSTVQAGAFTDCPALSDVYYLGTEAERNAKLTVEGGNDALMNAEWHYQEPCTFDGAVVWNDEDVQFKGTTPYMTWTGSALEPRFALNDAEGNPVDPQTYTYEYRENVDAGTGYVFVTFTEGYTGVLRLFFKIYLPATTQTSVENVADGIRISWAPVEGATGYVIYRRAWNLQSAGWTTFERWNNTTGTSWTDKTVYAGTRYQYGVKAYFAQRMDAVTGAMIGGNVGDNFNLGHVGPLKTTVRITTRHLVSLKPASGKITATWEASKVFTGYQLKYATNEAFTKDVKTVKIADPSTVSMVLKSLKNGTTYYVAVRSYHEFAGMTYFGQWSNVIRVKAGAVYTVYDVMYRALTIGENNYKTSPLKGCVNDATAMTGMLQGLNRPFTVNKLQNEKKASIINAIRTTFADAWDNDISVFTYSGHGVQASDSSNPYHGALVPIDEDYITLKELAQELSKVRGRIVVILDSCHSGAAIALDGGASETDAFNQAVIEAFSGYYLEDDAQEGEPGARMGEMRTSKFIVITAAGYWQSSYDGKFDGSGYDQGAFTAALIKGMGCRYTSGKYLGSMPADKNNDKKVTLKELYDYIVNQVRSWRLSQSAQYYGPDDFVLFKR